MNVRDLENTYGFKVIELEKIKITGRKPVYKISTNKGNFLLKHTKY